MQSYTQLVLQLVKVVKFLPHVRELFFQSAAHRRARLQTVTSQIQESANLAKFEPEALYASDKSEYLHVGFGVLTESALRSWRSREQSFALIESNRINAEADFLCDHTNLHGLRSFLEDTPWSIVQSRTFFLPVTRRRNHGSFI
jgi:hypothetical protein